MDPQVVRYSERPELWDRIGDLSAEVWPECNPHGETLNYCWRQLYDVFPDWQFVLYDPGEQKIGNPTSGSSTRPAAESQSAVS
jgi:hypothetical protein